MTLVVNLFAGPGTGKSTNAAAVFADLKMAGVSAELVHEFAKDLVWEDRQAALSYQPYVFGKQSYHIHRLLGKVDVIITDSPILLSSHIYSRPSAGGSTNALRWLGMELFKEWNTLNIFLERNSHVHPYVEGGRNQDEQESIELDVQIKNLLDDFGIEYDVVSMDYPSAITGRIKYRLARERENVS